MIQNFPPVEDEGRFGHVLEYPLVVQCHKLVPLSTNHNSMSYIYKKNLNILKIFLLWLPSVAAVYGHWWAVTREETRPGW